MRIKTRNFALTAAAAAVLFMGASPIAQALPAPWIHLTMDDPGVVGGATLTPQAGPLPFSVVSAEGNLLSRTEGGRSYFRFDGGTHLAAGPGNPALSIGADSFTISLWIRPDGINRSALVAQGGYCWSPGYVLDIPSNFYEDGEGGWVGPLRTEFGAPVYNAVYAEPAVRLYEWQHIAVAVQRDGSRMHVKQYVNGNEVASTTMASASLVNPSRGLVIGDVLNGCHGAAFVGDMDDVRIYRQALSGAELSAVMNSLEPSASDVDADGIADEDDNCVDAANADQSDTEGDGQGDACDADDDNDTWPDDADAFPFDPAEAADADRDGVGDNGDADDDNDTIPDAVDSYPMTPNRAPSCAGAAPSVQQLWPVNQRMVAVNISGLSDADDDPLTVAITSIRQDEPTSANGAPDASGVGSRSAFVRASRAGKGDGRVYHIAFKAADQALSCTGVVTVSVPHDQRGASPGDGGPLFDSTAGSR